ncbi:MAG: chorismate mutase [Acidobacteriota bacterium]
MGGSTRKRERPKRRGSRGPASADRASDGLQEMDKCRQQIDAIDEELLRLLNDRARCAIEVGDIKKRLGLSVYSAEREAEILGRAGTMNQGPLEEAAIRRLFERIIDESRRLERLAVQDPPTPAKED